MGLCLGARPDAGTENNHKKEQYSREPPSSLSTSPSSSAGSTNNGSTYPGANFPRSLSRCRSLQPGQSIEDQYDLHQQVGEGSLAIVHRALKRENSEEVAVKIIRKAKLYPDEVEDVFQEVEALSLLNHPNIIGLREFAEDDENYYVVMDLAKGGELRHRITTKTVYTENEARDLFVTLVSTISYVHSKNVVHRDLKLDNLLMEGDCDVTIKIADFGVAAVMKSEQEGLTKLCGTPWYIAPEILRGERYGKPVDMWSIGVILYILLGGSPPFYDKDETALFEKIKRAEFSFQPRLIWECVSDEAKDMVRGLLTLDPKKRLTAKDALHHPWIKLKSSVLRQHSLRATQNELLSGSVRTCPLTGASLRTSGLGSLHSGCSIRGTALVSEGPGLQRTTQMLE